MGDRKKFSAAYIFVEARALVLAFRPRKRPWPPYHQYDSHVKMTTLASKVRRHMSYGINTSRETIKNPVTQPEQTCTAGV